MEVFIVSSGLGYVIGVFSKRKKADAAAEDDQREYGGTAVVVPMTLNKVYANEPQDET